MTEKRDLKRRVRERQEKTGESYMTALRQVTSQREDASEGEGEGASQGAFPVVELVNCTEIGEALGLKCRILMAPDLVERVDTSAVLTRLRNALLTTTRDPALDIMRAVVLNGEKPLVTRAFFESLEFLQRLRAGLGGVSDSGRLLALTVDGRQGTEMVLFVLWLSPVKYVTIPPTVMIMRPDDMEVNPNLAVLPR